MEREIEALMRALSDLMAAGAQVKVMTIYDSGEQATAVYLPDLEWVEGKLRRRVEIASTQEQRLAMTGEGSQ